MIERIEVGSATPISVTFYAAGSETPSDADTPDTGVTYSVVHVNGTVIVAAGTVATHIGENTGQYSAPIPSQALPAEMIVTFTGTFNEVTRTKDVRVQVIDHFLCDLADIRALDGLGDKAKYPTWLLAEKRNAAEDLFESITGAWSPRYSLDILDGDSTYRRAYMPVESSWVYEPNLSRRLMLTHMKPRQVLSVSLQTFDPTTQIMSFLPDTPANAGVPFGGTQAQYLSANYFLYPGGEIERALVDSGWPRGVSNVQIEYLYGQNDSPYDLREALLQYIRELVVRTTNRISGRATSIQNESGMTMLGQAQDWIHPTGISDIDAILRRHDAREISIA